MRPPPRPMGRPAEFEELHLTSKQGTGGERRFPDALAFLRANKCRCSLACWAMHLYDWPFPRLGLARLHQVSRNDKQLGGLSRSISPASTDTLIQFAHGPEKV
jgi:hypothetical protein